MDSRGHRTVSRGATQEKITVRARRKGKRVEYKVRDLLRALGPCERVPLSGTRALKGDLILQVGGKTLYVEVKARKRGLKFLYDSLEGKDMLVVKQDRHPPLIVMTINTLESLLPAKRT